MTPRTVKTVDLSPRENRHIQPSIGRDVWDVVMQATLLGLLLYVGWVLVKLVMSV
jgi:hypothetical protein